MRRLALTLAAFALGTAAGWVASPRPDPRALAVPEAVTVFEPGRSPVELVVYRYSDSAGRVVGGTRPGDAPAWQLSFDAGGHAYHLNASPR